MPRHKTKKKTDRTGQTQNINYIHSGILHAHAFDIESVPRSQ